ncbi:MAG: hypothetical protein N2484_09465, partial [Clostridia bacterium]|nr:hypothetical protein [Clostridia bacterium]
MQQDLAINRNMNIAMSFAQKSSVWDTVNLQKFMEDKGFRPAMDIARNASLEASSFHKKMLAHLNNELKMKMDILGQILKTLKELLKKVGTNAFIRSEKHIHIKEFKKVIIIKEKTSFQKFLIQRYFAIREYYYKEANGAKKDDGKNDKESWLSKLIYKALETIVSETVKAIFGKLAKPGIESLIDKILGKFKSKKGSGSFEAGKNIFEKPWNAIKIGKKGAEMSKALRIGGRMGRVIPVAGIALGLLGSGMEIANATPKMRGRVIAGEAGGWLGGFAGGALTGAAAGAAFGGVGAIPGAIIGGIAGSIGGEKLGKWVYNQKDKVIKGVKDLSGVVRTLTNSFFGWIKNVFSSVGLWITNNWKKVVTTILLLMGPIGWGIMVLIALIRTNWNSIKETTLAIWNSISTFFANLWNGIKDTAQSCWNWIGEIINGVSKGIEGAWNVVFNWFSDKFTWVKGLISEILNNPVFEFISGGVKGAVDIAGKGLNIIGSGIDKGITNISNLVFGKDTPPEHSTGLSYVPFDGYIAELHKGERVMTASENRAYSNPRREYKSKGANGSGNTFNITINGVNKSTSEIINDLVTKISEAVNT